MRSRASCIFLEMQGRFLKFIDSGGTAAVILQQINVPLSKGLRILNFVSVATLELVTFGRVRNKCPT